MRRENLARTSASSGVRASARLAAALVALSAVAWAQVASNTYETGTVELMVSGEARTYHTYAVEVPENAGQGVENPRVRAELARIAGTTQHTATWNVNDPVVVNGVVLSRPSVLFVTVHARPTEDAGADLGQLNFEFAVSLDGLQQADPGTYQPSVKLYPESFSVTDYYALTDGNLTVTSVELADDFTLHVNGTFQGTFSFQTRRGVIEHNPDDTIEVSGNFDVMQVVGTKPLSEMLAGD